MVYNLCLNYLQNGEDAQEATQDVFVKIHQQLNRFQGKSALKTWIYRITINQCLDYIKARKRKKRFGFNISIFGQEEPLQLAPLSDFNHPGVLLEDKEAVEAIFKQINSLPYNQKTALILKVVDQLPQKEISAILEISEKAVESLLSRARSALKKKMALNEG